MSIPNLETTLKQLRLSGLAGTVSLRLQEAAANRLSHEEFLEILLQDELNVRQERLLSRRTKAADFHRLKPGGFQVLEHQVLVIVLRLDGDERLDALAAPHALAIAQHGDAVGEFKDLLEAMGNVDHANAAGAQVKRYDYSPFGSVIGESGTSPDSHRFTGQEADDDRCG